MLDRYVAVEAEAIRETKKAFLCTFQHENCRHVEVWIPKSQIHETSMDEIEEAAPRETIEIHVAEWWLKEQG
jgi:hypothetical protein